MCVFSAVEYLQHSMAKSTSRNLPQGSPLCFHGDARRNKRGWRPGRHLHRWHRIGGGNLLWVWPEPWVSTSPSPRISPLPLAFYALFHLKTMHFFNWFLQHPLLYCLETCTAFSMFPHLFFRSKPHNSWSSPRHRSPSRSVSLELQFRRSRRRKYHLVLLRSRPILHTSLENTDRTVWNTKHWSLEPRSR